MAAGVRGSGTPHYITACYNTNYDCSLSMQSGGPSDSFSRNTFFPGSIQTVLCTVYTV